jgi:hypothetical protein
VKLLNESLLFSPKFSLKIGSGDFLIRNFVSLQFLSKDRSRFLLGSSSSPLFFTI